LGEKRGGGGLGRRARGEGVKKEEKWGQKSRTTDLRGHQQVRTKERTARDTSKDLELMRDGGGSSSVTVGKRKVTKGSKEKQERGGKTLTQKSRWVRGRNFLKERNKSGSQKRLGEGMVTRGINGEGWG